MLHDSGTAAIQTSCFCQTKFINYINVFWRDCVPAGRTVTWLQQCSENPEFGTTLARRLNQSRASAVLQSNLIAIKFGTADGTTSELGLTVDFS